MKFFRFHLYFFYPSHCRLCKSVKKKFARWCDDPKYKDVHFAMGNVTEIEGEIRIFSTRVRGRADQIVELSLELLVR